MKKLMIFAMMLTMSLSTISAQTVQENAKERKALAKAQKKQLNEKASKASRKEAKKFEKEGWLTTPGALPLAKQFDKSYLMQEEMDDEGYPKFIMSEAMSIGENYDAAKMQATELAKQNLAGQIQTEITALIENSVANQQLGDEEAASITQSIMTAKNLISQSLGRTIPVIECYRVKENKNKEVMMRIAYSSKMAKKVAKKAIQNELKEKGEGLQNKLDEVLGLAQ